MNNLNFNPHGRIIKELVVHCSATHPDMDIGALEIDHWHRQRGFTRIGYHFVIRRHGEVEKGRPVSVPGAHVRGHNHDTIGICLVGGIDKDGRAQNNYTDQQFAALAELLIDLRKMFPYADILGHRDYSPDLNGNGIIESNEWLKDCPCFDVREWLRDTTLLDPSVEPLQVPMFYKVEPGDTMYNIARLHGTTVKALMEKNEMILNPNEIVVGEFIYIPLA